MSRSVLPLRGPDGSVPFAVGLRHGAERRESARSGRMRGTIIASMPVASSHTCTGRRACTCVRRRRSVRSGAVVEGDLVAVGVGEGERPAEGAVDRSGDDGVTVGDESVVNGLDVCGVEPDRGTDAGLGDGRQIGAGNDVAECERDRLRLEDDGVGRPGRRADEAEVLLVERLRSGEVARLEGDEVGAGGGHDDAPCF